jgi:hypothetical protein
MEITRIFRVIIYLLLVAMPTSSWALFAVYGQAIVKENSPVGVSGEQIEFSFSYSLSDFGGLTGSLRGYTAFTPIPQ